MKLCLRLSSLLVFLLSACAAPYKHLQPQVHVRSSAFIYKPVFDKILYRCTVNGGFLFKRYHLSGLLFFKTLQNGTVRAIYQNEMGFTFFDFEWDGNDSFRVNKIIPQLDKPVVVKLLHKDIDLFLMKGLKKETETVFVNRGKEQLHRLTIEKGYAYYVEKENRLDRIENAGRKRKVVTITISGKDQPGDMPKHVIFDHHKANFIIELNKIDSYANE